jgi:hypothetical protein
MSFTYKYVFGFGVNFGPFRSHLCLALTPNIRSIIPTTWMEYRVAQGLSTAKQE